MAGELIDRTALERIVKRAAELQAHEHDIGEGLTEGEVFALGKDVGIPVRYLKQAMLEEQTRTTPEAPAGLWAWLTGPGAIVAHRVVPGDREAIERAIAWCEQAMRLSPRDAMSCVPQGIIGFGNFLAGRHEQAVAAGRRAVEMNPGFSILHGWLAAPLARLGRIDEARAAGARLAALDPHFTIGGWSRAVGIAPPIIAEVTEALRLAGLPE